MILFPYILNTAANKRDARMGSKIRVLKYIDKNKNKK